MEMPTTTTALVEDDEFAKKNNRGAYYRAAGLMRNVANRCFGLNLSEDILIKWRYASVLIKKIDAVMDDEVDHLDKDEVTAYIIAKFGQSEEPSDVEYPVVEASQLGVCANLLRGTISDKQAEKFLQQGLLALSAAEDTRTTESIETFAKMTGLEGEITWTLYEALVDESEKTEGYEDFNECMLDLGLCSNIVDSVLDFELDHQSGLTALEPTMRNRLRVLMEFFPSGTRCVRAMGLQAIHLAKPTLSTYKSSKG